MYYVLNVNEIRYKINFYRKCSLRGPAREKERERETEEKGGKNEMKTANISFDRARVEERECFTNECTHRPHRTD